MRKLLSRLTRPPFASLAHVVHIGAGSGSDLAAYLKAGAGAVTLIEADADVASELAAQVGGKKGVNVIEAAVSGDLRRRPFRRANTPDLSSFRGPTGLKELFPGLRTLSKDPVRPMDPVRLIRGLDLPDPEPDSGSDQGSVLLVIEAPGEALGILKALAAARLLTRFDAIRLQEGVARLYHKAASIGEIQRYLRGQGFVAKLEKTPVDLERPYLNAWVDRKALKQKQDTRALAEVRAENAQLTQRCELAHKEAGTLRAELGTVQDEAQEKLRVMGDELALAQQQSSERGDEIRSHVLAREGEGQELEAVRVKLAMLQQQCSEQVDQIAALSAARDAIHQEAEAARQAQETTGRHQAQLREEMLKAEGQVSLIRDLLLQGPGL